MLKRTVFFLYSVLCIAVLLYSCEKGRAVFGPQISFDSFSPSDTLERLAILKTNFTIKDADANTDSVHFKKIFVDLKDTVLLGEFKLPVINSVVREASLNVSFYNGQVDNTGSPYKTVVLGDPKIRLDYNMQIQIWLTDKSGFVSDTVLTPTIYVKVQ